MSAVVGILAVLSVATCISTGPATAAPVGVPTGATGGVWVWGSDDSGQLRIPDNLTSVVAISAGHDHSLALRSDGTVASWEFPMDQATVPAGLSGVVAVSAGRWFSLALKNDGTVVGWGIQGSHPAAATVPTGLSGVTAIAAGFFSSMALHGDGTVTEWGVTQLGNLTVPVGLSGVVSIATGGFHSLALRGDGTVVAWGNDYAGQLAVPAGLTGVVAIAAGFQQSLALKSDGTVVQWGNVRPGDTSVPVGLTGVVAIASGDYHSLALKGDGTVVAWGDSAGGQTTPPPGLTGVTAIAAGATHSMALSATGQPSASRVSGADRYETSAAISAATFQPGVSVAYVSSGQNFPDALSGGAAAAFGKGPLLTVRPDGIPSAVDSELQRLKPRRIVLLGGPDAVADAVKTRLAAIAPTTRLSGVDRYGTSAAISAATFPPGASTVFVGSGENFPDALSGSAAAGRNAAPLLTVRPDGIPAAVWTELTRLAPTNIVLLGGPDAVSASVMEQLSTIAPTTRLAGSDRYGTSAALSAATYPADAATVYIASGENFPDALSGSAAASLTGAPILTVDGNSPPATVAAELARLRPGKIVVLGGVEAISYFEKVALAAYIR